MTLTYQQAPPYCVQVEMTEGCNLRCTFCGLNGIRAKDNAFKFMSPETAELIAAGMKADQWNSRIEFAMHGEPTMNPMAADIVMIFRKFLPKAKLMITSNGGGLAANPLTRISDLFNAGLDTLALDEYQDIKIVPKIKDKFRILLGLDEGVSLDGAFHSGIHLYEYPKNKEGNPHQRKNQKRIVFISPIDVSTDGTHATLNNHAGSGAPLDESAQGKRCAKPFRELSFRWDGSVAICCNDWRGEYVIGSIATHSLPDIWNHSRFQAARRKLYHGERTFAPCLGCNALSYRPGLLPDSRGKIDLPGQLPGDGAAIEAAQKDGPLTAPIRRSWEQE